MTQADLPVEPIDHDCFIGGEWVPAEGDGRIEVEYPYTREVWATVPEGGAPDVEKAVRAAQDCYESDAWQPSTATEGGRLLFDIAHVPEDQVEERRRLETRRTASVTGRSAARPRR